MIVVGNRILKQFDHFKYLRKDEMIFCTRGIKMRITIAKEAFNRKMSLFISKLSIELWKEWVRCYVWSILYMAQRYGH